MKALKPDCARRGEPVQFVEDFPGTSPPHRPKSVMDDAASAARLRSNSSEFVVHGVELSGISKNVVPPPAASARLPVAAPSHSVRPGSLKCRWTSMMPGRMSSPLASISSRAPPISGPTARQMRPSVHDGRFAVRCCRRESL